VLWNQYSRCPPFVSISQQIVRFQPAVASCHRSEALDSGNFEAGASYIDTFMDLEEKYGPVSDGDGQQAAEQEQVRGVAQHTLTAVTAADLLASRIW
jgi:hypothetical protein